MGEGEEGKGGAVVGFDVIGIEAEGGCAVGGAGAVVSWGIEISREITGKDEGEGDGRSSRLQRARLMQHASSISFSFLASASRSTSTVSLLSSFIAGGLCCNCFKAAKPLV